MSSELSNVIPIDAEGQECVRFDGSTPSSPWVSFWPKPADDHGLLILIRVGDFAPTGPDGRRSFSAQGLWVHNGMTAGSGGRIPDKVIRQTPLLRIEAAINMERHKSRVNMINSSSSRWPVAPVGAERWNLSAAGARDRKWLMRPREVSNPAPTLNMALVDADGQHDFYVAVAEAWLWLTATGSPKPVERLAQANNKKPATVYGWLHDARNRGILVAPAVRSSKKTARRLSNGTSASPSSPSKKRP